MQHQTVMDISSSYQKLIGINRKVADIGSAIAVLQWDKEVGMPTKGVPFRSQQIATLSGMAHELSISPAVGELIEMLHAQDNLLTPEEARNVSLMKLNYDRYSKLSEDFVMRRSVACSKAYHQWVQARAANDFSIFKDALAEIVTIKQEEAATIGFKVHPYDELLNEFEPNYTSSQLDELFAGVKVKLIDFVRQIPTKAQVDDRFLHQFFPKQTQWDFSNYLLRKLGYDAEAGRQDWSRHPFTISFSPQDVRVTTRVDEQYLGNLLWSSIHECGHALYEQGLPTTHYGQPLGRPVSLGIHESQSRLWENNVGCSLSFWKGHYQQLKTTFPTQLGQVGLNDFYKGINLVAPTLIRTEADELHYHFHIMIRYELEKALIEGSLAIDDLEAAWNKRYKDYMDVEVPDALHGILQDIHWAYGNIGYFPTYSLGSFYAAQFFQKAVADLPDLEAQMQQGKTDTLLEWLRTNIHQKGQLHSANDLCQQLTGETLNFDYFYQYAVQKYSAIYGL